MMRFEPRLHIDAETAGLIDSTTLPLLESPTVIVTDAYPFPRAAEIVGDEVRVRAATGDELTAVLTVGDAPNPDDFEWPGDPGLPAGREIEWQEKQDSEVELDRACLGSRRQEVGGLCKGSLRLERTNRRDCKGGWTFRL